MAQKREKRTFSVFDVFLLVAAALAISLAVYFRVESSYQVHETESPVYDLVMQGTLFDWEEDAVPADRQRLLDENGDPMGRVIATAVVREGGERVLRLECEWEGDLPEGMMFRMETTDLLKTMRITDISVITEGRT